MLHWHLSDELCHTAAPIHDKDSPKKSFLIHSWALLTQKRWSEIRCRPLFNPGVTQTYFSPASTSTLSVGFTPTHKQKQTKTFSLTKTLRNVAYSSSLQLSSQFLSSCNVGMPHTARNSTWNSLQISKALEKATHPVCTWGGSIRCALNSQSASVPQISWHTFKWSPISQCQTQRRKSVWALLRFLSGWQENPKGIVVQHDRPIRYLF